MDRLLSHIDAITRQRQRSELAVRLVVALQDLLGARRVSLYKAFSPPGDLLVGLVAEADPTGVHNFDDGASWPEGTGSIERFPHLRQRLASGETWTKVTPSAAHRVVELRHDHGELLGFVDIQTATPVDDEQARLIDGLLLLMKNCLALLDYSETDTLTGLLNRKTFDQHLIDILSTIAVSDDDGGDGGDAPKRRRTHPGASRHWLGVLDVDHFKAINDRFGHLIGDEVLILLAQMMKASFRAQDRLFRFGGEEFVALLRPTEFEHAHLAFERFRREVEAHAFPQVGRVTLSIGFTAIEVTDTPSEVLGNADEALYWAKQHGRNRTSSYEQLLADGSLSPHLRRPSDVEIF